MGHVFQGDLTDTGIQGDSAHPWNSLTGITGGQWGQPTFRLAGYPRPLLANMDYFHRVSTGNTDAPDNLGNPPVHPGDTIMLMSGNYGDLGIGVGGVGTHYDNSDFLTIKAAPGQTPVFTTISVANVSKYIFDGLKVQSLNTTGAINGDWLVSVTDGGVTEPTHDIIFANMDISSADAIGTTQATMKNTWRNGYREAAHRPRLCRREGGDTQPFPGKVRRRRTWDAVPKLRGGHDHRPQFLQRPPQHWHARRQSGTAPARTTSGP